MHLALCSRQTTAKPSALQRGSPHLSQAENEPVPTAGFSHNGTTTKDRAGGPCGGFSHSPSFWFTELSWKLWGPKGLQPRCVQLGSWTWRFKGNRRQGVPYPWNLFYQPVCACLWRLVFIVNLRRFGVIKKRLLGAFSEGFPKGSEEETSTDRTMCWVPRSRKQAKTPLCLSLLPCVCVCMCV